MGEALEAGQVFRAMPVLRDLTERLAWRLGDEVRLPLVADQGPRLIVACIATAMRWIEDCPIEGAVTLRKLQTAYAAGLLLQLRELPFIVIEVDGEPWSESEGEDLGAALARGARVTSAFIREEDDRDVNPMRVRLLMLTQLYPNGGHMLLDIDIGEVVEPTREPPLRFIGEEES